MPGGGQRNKAGLPTVLAKQSALKILHFYKENQSKEYKILINLEHTKFCRSCTGENVLHSQVVQWQRICLAWRLMRRRFHPCVGKIPWRRKLHPLQSSCLGNSMDRGTLEATYSPWGGKESDMTEHTHSHTPRGGPASKAPSQLRRAGLGPEKRLLRMAGRLLGRVPSAGRRPFPSNHQAARSSSALQPQGPAAVLQPLNLLSWKPGCSCRAAGRGPAPG